MIYYFPLLFNFFLFLSFRNLNSKIWGLVSILLLSVITIFVAFRTNSDVDYLGYIFIYNSVGHPLDVLTGDSTHIHSEISFKLLNSVIKYLGLPFYVVTGICAVLSIFGKLFFFRQIGANSLVAFSLYFSFYFITVEFIQMRWAVAVAFCVLSLMFFSDKKYKNSFYSFFIAFFFHHYSIIVLFVFVVLCIISKFSSFRIKLIFVCAMFIVSLVVSFTIKGITFTNVDDYGSVTISRIVIYLTDEGSYKVGFFSYLKSFILVGSVVFISYIQGFRYLADPFIFKLFASSVILAAYAVMVSFVPVFFLRAIVVSELILIALIVFLISKFKYNFNKLFFILFLGLIATTWFFLDVRNNFINERIFPYHNVII